MAPLWQVSIATTPAAEEAVTELLQTVFGQPAVSHTDFETGRVTAAVFLARKPRRFRRTLRDRLRRLREFGLRPGPAAVALRKLRPRDWTRSWRRHFRPIAIGSALLIRPSWSRRRARQGQAEIVLDPGLSFGTGQHPTTAFCLEQLLARRDPGRRQTCLDIGTGSGILAIAAAKLGYAAVEAFDSDREAVRIARGNARRNQVHTRIRFYRADLTQPATPGAPRHDLICANLVSTLILSARKRILRRLKPGGILVLAGILKSEFPQVACACRAAGLKLVAQERESEWQSGAFLRPGRACKTLSHLRQSFVVA